MCYIRAGTDSKSWCSGSIAECSDAAVEPPNLCEARDHPCTDRELADGAGGACATSDQRRDHAHHHDRRAAADRGRPGWLLVGYGIYIHISTTSAYMTWCMLCLQPMYPAHATPEQSHAYEKNEEDQVRMSRFTPMKEEEGRAGPGGRNSRCPSQLWLVCMYVTASGYAGDHGAGDIERVQDSASAGQQDPQRGHRDVSAKERRGSLRGPRLP